MHTVCIHISMTKNKHNGMWASIGHMFSAKEDNFVRLENLHVHVYFMNLMVLDTWTAEDYVWTILVSRSFCSYDKYDHRCLLDLES